MASSIHINEDIMSLDIDGTATTVATKVGNLWQVPGWPRLLSRNEAITALVIAERLAA